MIPIVGAHNTPKRIGSGKFQKFITCSNPNIFIFLFCRAKIFFLLFCDALRAAAKFYGT
jgi:hypothetical protein